MLSNFLKLTSFAFLLSVLPGVAHADYYVWDHQKTGVTLTYPDTWKLTNNRKPSDIFTVAGPNDYRDHPRCSLNVRDDRRFLIYPPEYSHSVQKIAYSSDFWETEVRKRYHNPEVIQFGDNAGLGKGFGSYVIVDYVVKHGDKDIEMRALANATLYAGKAYYFECTARRDGFDKWQPLFQSIGGSIDFQKVYSEHAHGFYRNFINN